MEPYRSFVIWVLAVGIAACSQADLLSSPSSPAEIAQWITKDSIKDNQLTAEKAQSSCCSESHASSISMSKGDQPAMYTKDSDFNELLPIDLVHKRMKRASKKGGKGKGGKGGDGKGKADKGKGGGDKDKGSVKGKGGGDKEKKKMVDLDAARKNAQEAAERARQRGD